MYVLSLKFGARKPVSIFLGGETKKDQQKKTIENSSGGKRNTQFRDLEINLACQTQTKGDGLGVKSSERALANRILLWSCSCESELTCKKTQEPWHHQIHPGPWQLKVREDQNQGFSPLTTPLREPVKLIGPSVRTCPDFGWNGIEKLIRALISHTQNVPSAFKQEYLQFHYDTDLEANMIEVMNIIAMVLLDYMFEAILDTHLGNCWDAEIKQKDYSRSWPGWQ